MLQRDMEGNGSDDALKKIHFVVGLLLHCCRAVNHPVMVKANNFQCSNHCGGGDDDDDDDDWRGNNDFGKKTYM